MISSLPSRRADRLFLLIGLLAPLSAGAGDILWYTGDGGTEVSSLTAVEGAAGLCSTGADQTPRWPADLSDYRLVFLSVTSDALSSSQQADLAAYLDEGRTLVLVGDSAWFNVPHVAAHNTLLASLGVGSRFVSGVSYDPDCMKQASRVSATALTEGVKAITYAYSGDIDPAEDATVLFSGESGQALVVSHDNLVLAADLNIFEEGCPMGPGNLDLFANLYRGACLLADADEDGDGFTSAACGGDDCDDRDATRTPDQIWYPDEDGDGLGDPARPTVSCCPPPGLLDNGEDCDDTDPDILWGDVFFRDDDGDGHGSPDAPLRACTLPDGAARLGDDCDDTRIEVSPDAAEVCNGIDDDCDEVIDEAGALGEVAWFEDRDGDGYGSSATSAGISCDAPDGAVGNREDCDDTDPDISPAAVEVCNDRDDDCDGGIDDISACQVDEDADPGGGQDDTDGCGGGCGDQDPGQAGLLAVPGLLWAGRRRRRRQRVVDSGGSAA